MTMNKTLQTKKSATIFLLIVMVGTAFYLIQGIF